MGLWVGFGFYIYDGDIDISILDIQSGRFNRSLLGLSYYPEKNWGYSELTIDFLFMRFIKKT